MTAPHFFAPMVDGDVITLTGEEATHASRALRIRPGETITVGNGAGAIVTATVEEVGATLTARVTERRASEPRAPHLTVMPAVLKGDKLELVVQKLTELGVDAIVPWIADRTIVRWDEHKIQAHLDRLRAIAFEAAKQSRRAWLPEVDVAPGLPDLGPHAVVLHEDERSRPFGAALAPEAESVRIVIGPEGGLSDDEVARARAQGATVAGLGEQILRAETASIAAATLALSKYGRLG